MKNHKWWAIILWVSVLSNAQQEQKLDTLKLQKNKVLHQTHISAEISKKELEKSSGENLANLLNRVSGVTMLQSGSNISKPVIQGLSNQRIAVLNNGIKVESQQWGHDHAPEIDPFLAQNIEVIKGAEAVKYGSNALGGIVLLKTPQLPYFGEKMRGKLQFLGESNHWKGAGNLMLEGNFYRNNALAWRVQSSVKNAGNYRTADYWVENTGAKELNYSAVLGYKMPKEKVEAFYSYFSTELGVFRGSRIGSPVDWDLRLELGRPIDTGEFRREIQNPRQKVHHHLAKFLLESQRDFGKINLVYAFQKNHRQEYDLRRGSFAQKPSLDVELTTHSLNLDYEKPHHEFFKFFAGASGVHQQNYNIQGNGVNSILPNFLSDSWGLYLGEEFRQNSWTLSAGLRFDYKDFDAAGYDRLGNYYKGQRKYQHWSYNLGLHKVFSEKWAVSSQLGMAWRAPEAIELFSNGVHHGSAFYLQGDENLGLERGLKWSSKIRYSGKKIEVSADVFLQKIKGFIYEMPTRNYINTWGGYFPLFEYKQSDAFLRGVDIDLKYKPLQWLQYEAKASAVYANNLSENFYFPNISPENIFQELTFKNKKIKGLSDAYFSINHHWVNQQKRFSPEADLLPTSPSAYHLLGASLGAEISVFRSNDFNFSLNVDNLLNHLYKDYTDRFRYFTHAMGRNFQLRVNYEF